MNRLENIGIEVVPYTGETGYSPQLVAIFNELRDLLQTYRREGVAGNIDLRSLPMFPGDYETLKNLLGEGEIMATLNALGPSEIRETAIPGIWWITHRNIEGDTIAEVIEVTSLPELIRTPEEDLVEAVDKLEKLITELAAPDHL